MPADPTRLPASPSPPAAHAPARSTTSAAGASRQRRSAGAGSAAPARSRAPATAALPLTPWFPGHQQPAREGVYRRRAAPAPFACWSGTQWHADAATPEDAAASRRVSPQQALPWRGVATPPPGPCFACRGHTVIDHGWDDEEGLDRIEECAAC